MLPMAGNKVASNAVAHECHLKCNSQKHASHLTAALTRISLTDEEVAAYLKWCCVRYSKAVDSNGRSLLHMAASVGRPKLLAHLLKHRGININEKDKESHYTPLHRSLFYGNIDCAVRLIEHGANVDQLDLDNLTPLDHTIEDVPFSSDIISGFCKSFPKQNCEVYVWGSNTNYTLGIGSHQSRANPEPLECFRKRKIPISQVVMSKFHSAFIDYYGYLWTCGHGQGGRLGLGNETTTLTPKKVNNKRWDAVALGTDHTLVLAEHSVYSFGLNTYHQLGHAPPPDKVLSPEKIKHFSQDKIIGMNALKYHSVFWSKTKLFTCGLNGGQLGHSKSSEHTIIVPKAVSIKGEITLVASSDYATVLVTDSDGAYLLYNYKCQKITIGGICPKMIQVAGGRLDHEINSEALKDKGGDLLRILLIHKNNAIFLWQEDVKRFFHCDMGLHREIQIIDVALNKNSVLFVFFNGKAFEGEIKTSQKKWNANNRNSRLETVKGYIKLKRIPYIYRGIKITCDVEGRNFAVIQFIPEGKSMCEPQEKLAFDMDRLFHNLEKNDCSQDVTFEVEEHRYSAHRYVVAYSSSVLEVMMNQVLESEGVCVVKIKKMKPHIFLKILYFMYTGSCCYCDPSFSLECTPCIEYHCVQSPDKWRSGLNLLLSAADRFRITKLQNIIRKKLKGDSITYDLTFNRNALLYLWDIVIESADGNEYKAHKFMLASRSEFFKSFINRWLDDNEEARIILSIPGKIVSILLNYLYRDGNDEIMETEDIDFLILLYTVADEYLFLGLREWVACRLVKLLSFENAADILHLASVHNDKDLQLSAMLFIGLNLPAFLEYRSLENLPDWVLAELTMFYKNTMTPLFKRQITPYYDAPDDELIGLISKTEPVSLDIVEEELPIKPLSKTPKKRNRKSGRTRNTSSDSFTSEEEPEPLGVIDLNDLTDKDEEESWVKVVNHPPKPQKNIQTKVRAPVEMSKVIDSPAEEDKFVSLSRTPEKTVQNLETKFRLLNTSSEEEFPALNASSPVQKTVCSGPQAPRPCPKTFEKIVKLPQRMRKRLLLKSGTGDGEEAVEKNEIKSPWGISKIETQQLSDIMKEESRGGAANQKSSMGWNPPWQRTSEPESNLSDVMELERKRRELYKKMKAVEDKAIEDLLLLYNAKNVTDERITVIRANQDFLFLPV